MPLPALNATLASWAEGSGVAQVYRYSSNMLIAV